MKKQTLLSTMLCMVMGLSSVPTFAQSIPSIKVNVPFTFRLNDKTYPAGEYTFSAMKDNVVILQKTEHTGPAMIMANRTARPGGDNSPSVRFECYDSQCFVSQVWIPGHDGGFELHRSHAEIRIAAKTRGKYVALLGMAPQR